MWSLKRGHQSEKVNDWNVDFLEDVSFSSVIGKRCVLCFQKECLHACLPVHMCPCPGRIWACVCEGGLCVPAHMCMAVRVFLGVFSGRELSDMMTDVTLIIHTLTHTLTVHISWQVKAVSYLENREVIQTNCTCFWNGLTSNCTGRDSHTIIHTHTHTHTRASTRSHTHTHSHTHR